MTKAEIEEISELERRAIFYAKSGMPDTIVEKAITKMNNYTRRALYTQYEGREYNTGSQGRELKQQLDQVA
jgi:hypothetical protein